MNFYKFKKKKKFHNLITLNIKPSIKNNKLNSLLKQIVLSSTQNIGKEKKAKPFRDAILFDDVIKNNKIVCIYNCKNKVFIYEFLKNFLLIAFAAACFFLFYYSNNYRKHRTLFCASSLLFIIARLKNYRNFQKYFVESVFYNTSNGKFDINKRGFFGRNILFKMEKHKILYTEDAYLNAKYINYINMETLDCFGIHFTYAWQNKRLFTYLISQRIK